MMTGQDVEVSGRGIFSLEEPRKATKNINQCSRSPGLDLNPGLFEYEAVC